MTAAAMQIADMKAWAQRVTVCPKSLRRRRPCGLHRARLWRVFRVSSAGISLRSDLESRWFDVHYIRNRSAENAIILKSWSITSVTPFAADLLPEAPPV